MKHMQLIIWGLLALLAGCDRIEPIKVGFSGNLTGRAADVGVDARNGTLLAVEEINAKGGIKGRPIELIVKDDQNNPEVARKVAQELIDAKVVAILGHVVSGMTQAALPIVNEKNMLLISPTSVSNVFTGKDDFLIRISPSAKAVTAEFAGFAKNKVGVRNLAVIYDLANKSYSEDWHNNFREAFEAGGGRIASTYGFTSGPDNSFSAHAKRLLTGQPDGIVIIAGAVDTAMICQQIRKINATIPIFSSGWAMTNDLLSNGGTAVEGVYLSYNFDRDSNAPAYVAFRNSFEKRYGNSPGFAAKFGYESVMLLADALGKAPKLDSETLKQTILRQGVFTGLQGNYKIDAFGDAEAQTFFFTIKNGAYQRVE